MYRLLIADDEPIVADSLAEYVNWRELGFEVSRAVYSVEEALEAVKEQMVDVILTDIIMGENTGLGLLEEVMSRNPEIVGVIISGHEDFSYARTALRLGVYDYLVKPVDIDELEAVFQKIYRKLEDRKTDGGAGDKEEDEQEKSEGLIIKNVKEYIEIHYGDNITLNLLAEKVYVHPAYLSTLFKRKTGCNFKEYLTEVRVNKARELLNDVSLRISDVAALVGYDGPKHFSKVFREITGLTPTDYRNRIVEMSEEE